MFSEPGLDHLNEYIGEFMDGLIMKNSDTWHLQTTGAPTEAANCVALQIDQKSESSVHVRYVIEDLDLDLKINVKNNEGLLANINTGRCH